MCIYYRSGGHTFCFGALSSPTVIRWSRWRSGPRWHRLWWRCTRAFVTPASLWILCCAIVARKTAIRLIFMNHYQVSFYRSLHLVMPGTHNTPLPLFPDFSMRLFISCCVCSIAVHENHSLAILAIFKARRMSDCSSCT